MLVAAALSGTVEGRQSTFAVQVDGVTVDVQVTRRGRPVAGLRPDDFELRDNGVVQRIESVTREEVPLDLFLVLDSSGSVAGEPLEALVAAARMALGTLAPRDRVALVTFNHRVTGPARLSSDRAAVLTALDRMTASGATSLVDALYAALVLRQASAHRGLVIVFTDGRDTSSWLHPSAVLDVASQTDAVVYGVALAAPGSTRDPFMLVPDASALLAGIRTPPKRSAGGRLLDTSQTGRLRDLFGRAVREMKTRYVLSYTPEGVERVGSHSISVNLTRRKADISHRKRYVVASERK